MTGFGHADDTHSVGTSSKTNAVVQLVLLAIAAWAVSFARYTLGPLQETMQADLGLSDNQIALLQGPAIAVPMAIVAIPLGLIVDRYSRVSVFLFLGAANVAASIAVVFSADFTVLVASRVVAGAAAAGVLVAAYSMIGDLFSPAGRGRATMVLAIGEIGGAPAGFALGGAMLALNASFGSLDSWRFALMSMSLLLIVPVLSAFALREPSRERQQRHNSERKQRLRTSPLTWFRPLWEVRALVGTLIIARVMVWIADGAVVVWAAPMLSRNFGLPPEQIGAIMGGSLLVGALLGPIGGGPLADFCHARGGPRRAVQALVVLSLLCLACAPFALAPTPLLVGLAMTCFLAFGFMIGVAAATVGLNVIPAETRGLYVALQTTIGAFFFGIAPLLVSGLSGALGGQNSIGLALTIVCVVTSAAGVITFLIGYRLFPRVTTAEPSSSIALAP